MALKIAVEPAEEPVTVAEAKAHLRVDLPDDDALIEGLIAAARQWVEQYTRRALVSQTWDLTGDGWPAARFIYLPLPPLVSVTSITGTDEAGTVTTVSSAVYLADVNEEPGRVWLKTTGSWPVTEVKPGGFKIKYVAGYGAAAAVPQVFKQAILLIVGHLYENREDVVVGNLQAAAIPGGAKMLLWPWRVMRFDF